MPSRPSPSFAHAAVLAAGWLAVFVAPWHSPWPTSPAVSDSYMLGFDNRIAMLGALATCAALLAVGWRRRGGGGALVLAAAPPREERVSRLLVGAFLAIAVVSGVFFAWLAYRSYGYGEKNYFLDRLAYVLAGFTPFRDVEFTYGPLPAYLPAWVAGLLRPLGVSVVAAYSATFVALFAAGIPLLAWCVDRLAMTRGQRNATFAAIGLSATFNETVGLNGLLVRFLMPAAAMLALHALASRATGRARVPAVAGAIALVGLAGFAMSPEVGIAVLAGAAVYLTALARNEPRVLPAAAGLAVPPLALWALFGAGALRHLVGMAGGALNFPVVPGPPVLVLLAGAAAAAALLPRHLARDDASAPAALAVAVASAAMLVGALGRADSSHAYFYGLSLALVACAVLARRSARAFTAYAITFAAVFLAAHLITVRSDYGAAIVSAAATHTSLRPEGVRTLGTLAGLDPAAVENLMPKTASDDSPEADPAPFAPFAPIAAPAGFRDSIGLELSRAGMLAPAYFRGTPFTPAQLDEHIASLRAARHLLVPASFAASLEDTAPSVAPPVSLGGDRYLTLLMWPERFPVRRQQPDLGGELVLWVRAHYRPVTVIGGYTVLERKE